LFAAVAASPIAAFATFTSLAAFTSFAAFASLAAARSCTAISAARLFDGPPFQHSLAAQSNLAARVYVDYHRCQLISQLGDILNFIHTIVGKLADMHHSIDSRHDVHKCAVRLNTHNRALQPTPAQR
jgi:hypothetical protein